MPRIGVLIYSVAVEVNKMSTILLQAGKGRESSASSEGGQKKDSDKGEIHSRTLCVLGGILTLRGNSSVGLLALSG